MLGIALNDELELNELTQGFPFSRNRANTFLGALKR